MNPLTVRTIFQKEMLDTFRDKRTMLTMVGVPIILYPALFIVSVQMMMVQQSKVDSTASRIVLNAPEENLLWERFATAELIELQEDIDDPLAALDGGDVDAVVTVDNDFDATLGGDESAGIKVEFDQTEPNSREAEDRIFDVLSEWNTELLEARLQERSLPEGFARPLDIESENIATASKSSGTVLGAILPLIMVVMLSLGAFYPAVDLTAGEKERGTFETLLSTPATKLEIVTGKFFAVFTLSMLTGFLNLASMAITFYFQMSQILSQRDLVPSDEQLIDISVGSILGIAIVLIPLAFFISAIMMSVAVLARSFKEAQNYVSPIFIFIMLPVMAVTIPGMELTATTQFIPITNISLLFRDLIMGDAQMEYYFTVFICTCIYAMFALVVATWMFQREEVILSEEKGLPLTLDRRAFSPSALPTPGTSLGIFAVVMLLIFYVGTTVQARQVHSGLLITQYLLIAAPVLFLLWFVKVDIKSTLSLNLPKPMSAVSVIVASVGWVFVVVQLGYYHNQVLPVPPEFQEAMRQLFVNQDADPIPLLALLFIIAVSPAICEEILFRGVITSGLRRVMTPTVTILVVGLLFGLFHLSIYRVALTGISGVVFTYFVVRSGSIYLPMIAHFILNGLAVTLEMEAVPEALRLTIIDRDIEANGLPMSWFLGGIVVFVIGIALFEKSVRSKPTISSDTDPSPT